MSPQPTSTRNQLAVRYGLAILLSAAAFATALSLSPRLVELAPFLLAYAAVAISSWSGGFGPGLLATLLGAAAVDYFLLRPRYAFITVHSLDAARLGLFLGVGILISWLNGQLRAAKRLCEISEREARRSEARARRLAEANLIAVFFADLDGNVRAGNEEFLRLVGCAPHDLDQGRVNWLKITAPEHRHLDAHGVGELKRCRVCTPFEKQHLLDNGRRIPVLFGCAFLDDPPDECVGFVLDLSERHRIENELRAHQEKLAGLSSELMLAEQKERRRIAAVLHDSIGQNLALARMKLGAIDHDAGPPIAQKVEQIVGLIEQVIGRTRDLTSQISPPVLYELGLAPAVRWLAARFRDEYGIFVEVRGEKFARPLGNSARFVLFEAVRELLVNVTKHAGASDCVIEVGGDDTHAVVTVRDRGKGFRLADDSVSSAGGGDGFGLFNIRERLTHLGGRMEIRAQPGEGTSVTLAAPFTFNGSHESKGKPYDFDGYTSEDCSGRRPPDDARGASEHARRADRL